MVLALVRDSRWKRFSLVLSCEGYLDGIRGGWVVRWHVRLTRRMSMATVHECSLCGKRRLPGRGNGHGRVSESNGCMFFQVPRGHGPFVWAASCQLPGGCQQPTPHQQFPVTSKRPHTRILYTLLLESGSSSNPKPCQNPSPESRVASLAPFPMQYPRRRPASLLTRSASSSPLLHNRSRDFIPEPAWHDLADPITMTGAANEQKAVHTIAGRIPGDAGPGTFF